MSRKPLQVFLFCFVFDECHQILKQAAQRGCGISILGYVQDCWTTAGMTCMNTEAEIQPTTLIAIHAEQQR